jgi:nucleoside-diphosphate-sugar epimerase
MITGGSGYLGGLIAERLNKSSQEFVSVDMLPPAATYECGSYYNGNICDCQFLESIFKRHSIEIVYHFATQIDFRAKNQTSLYENNVESTKNVAEMCKLFRVKKLIFTSSNSIYLGNEHVNPFSENDMPIPIDAYGKSKVFCETILESYKKHFDYTIFRCPNIMDAGRVGMLSILFDFVRENRTCWMIGRGNINHQCIYAQDLFDAMFLSLKLSEVHTFNIGSENVETIKEMLGRLILHAKSKSEITSIPASISVPLLKFLHWCGLSPLGPYQFRMLTKDFSFDISHVKSILNWQPTTSNSQMLEKAYDYYINNLDSLSSNSAISANRSRMKMGIIKMVKFLS